MDLDEARDYLRSNHHAVLATMRRDGTPQMSPVACTVDGDGRVVVSSRETAVKVKNVRREPRAWLCVFPDAFYGGFVQVEGSVDVVSLPEAMDGLVDYYRSIAGEHPDWDDYRAAMEKEHRVLIRLDLTRAGPDVEG
ncbi:MAG TPA: PPOX class F420-dependent oxidoreductase [Mycobacteriales bacterium]|nr:PPOX class F420-dependent oxidoreductase [Mycobacteriales bacterium]